MVAFKIFLANALQVAARSQDLTSMWWAEAAANAERNPEPAFLEFQQLIERDRPSHGGNLTVDLISFDDIIKELPDNYSVQTSWDCIGHQPNSNYVYVCYTTWKNTFDRSLFANQDTLVFRYDIATRERRFIGTFMEAAAKAKNLWKKEIIPKGHTHIVHADGHMYIGSQNFHDFKFGVNVTELDSYHGGHFFSIDTDTLELKDATAAKSPHGVGVDHQGIVAQSTIPEMGLVVGLTHPYSDLAFFNFTSQALARNVKGIPYKAKNPLGREIVALPNGHVYLYRGVEDPREEDPDTSYPVWMYDYTSDRMAPTSFNMSNGFWDSHAYKRDGSGIYIASCLGQLWYMDTKTEKWTDLGIFLTKDKLDQGIRIASMYTMALSPEEDKLYAIVSFYYPKAFPKLVVNGGDLYVKDLKTGEVSFVQFLGHGVYTGSGVTIENSMYFAKAGTLLTGYWIGDVKLGILHFGSNATKVEYV